MEKGGAHAGVTGTDGRNVPCAPSPAVGRGAEPEVLCPGVFLDPLQLAGTMVRIAAAAPSSPAAKMRGFKDRLYLR